MHLTLPLFARGRLSYRLHAPEIFQSRLLKGKDTLLQNMEAKEEEVISDIEGWVKEIESELVAAKIISESDIKKIDEQLGLIKRLDPSGVLFRNIFSIICAKLVETFPVEHLLKLDIRDIIDILYQPPLYYVIKDFLGKEEKETIEKKLKDSLTPERYNSLFEKFLKILYKVL